LLEAAPGPKYKAALSAAYAAGLRVSEVVALKVSDVTGGVNPRIDGAGWTGEEKGPSRRFGLFNGMAVQIDRLSVALSV
jgi:site-specific recombinase XerD